MSWRQHEYDTWKYNNPDELDYLSPEDYGWVKREELPDLDMTKDYIKGMVEALNDNKDFENLKRCLEELCDQFNVEFK